MAGQPFDLPLPPPGTPQLPAGISLCMIVKNEERYLEQCLRSAAEFVDEICIVDTGSQDRTVEIAQRFGARVEHHAWRDDFAWARNKAIDMATKRWIFFLDADEELTEDSRASLAALRGAKAGVTGLYIRCENLSDDYKGTGTMSHLLARVFPNHPKIRYISPVHEYISYDGSEMGIDTKLSDIRIIHHGYLQGIVAERNKAQRNLLLIKKACEEHPDDPFHWYNYGMTAHVLRDYPTAIMGLEKMRELLKGQARGFLPAALVTLAECYCEQSNDLEKALAVVEECIASVPHLPNAHFTLGRIYARMGRRAEAREAFLAAIDDAQHRHIQFIVDDQIYQWKAQLSLGVGYAEERNWDEAIAWYDRGLQNQPNVQPLLLNKAHALEGAQRYEEAEDAFRSVYEQFGDETSIIQYINYLLRRNDKHRALEMMERTVSEVSPRIAATFFVAAASYAQRSGSYLEELSYLQRALECDPACGPVLDALEAFYLARKDDAMLEKLYAEEFNHDPVFAPDFVRRSYRLIALERFPEAAAAAELGIKLSPLDPELRYNAAAAYAQLKNAPAALEHLRVIPLDAPNVAEKALLLAGMVHRDAGSAEEALPLIDLLLARKPGQIDALLLKAQCLEKCGRAQEAADLLEGAMRQDPARVAIELASIYLRAGRFSDAQRVAEHALTPG